MQKHSPDGYRSDSPPQLENCPHRYTGPAFLSLPVSGIQGLLQHVFSCCALTENTLVLPPVKQESKNLHVYTQYPYPVLPLVPQKAPQCSSRLQLKSSWASRSKYSRLLHRSGHWLHLQGILSQEELYQLFLSRACRLMCSRLFHHRL